MPSYNTSVRQRIVNDVANLIAGFNDETTCRVLQDKSGEPTKMIIRQEMGRETLVIKLTVDRIDIV